MSHWFRKYIDILVESDQFPDREPGRPYVELSDAGEQYAAGDTQIWFSRGVSKTVNPRNLAATHVLIGTLKETDPETVFNLMQSESWNPEGLGDDMLNELGVKHASMSAGDLIIVGREYHLVTKDGIKQLGKSK